MARPTSSRAGSRRRAAAPSSSAPIRASTHDQNAALRAQLQRDGVAVEDGLPDDLRPGVVAFVDSGDVNHDDFVNVAWTSDPLSAVLSRVDR